MKKIQYFSKDIREFLFLLARHGVRYLIVGGEAVIYYGHARLTGDIDLFYETKRKNTQNLYSALGDFWNGKIPGVESSDELKEEGMVFQFGVPPNRIDLISVVEGATFSEAWKRKSTEMLTRGRKRFGVHYIGLDDLIANKSALGRPRDKEDLKFLKKVKERNKRWAEGGRKQSGARRKPREHQN